MKTITSRIARMYQWRKRPIQFAPCASLYARTVGRSLKTAEAPDERHRQLIDDVGSMRGGNEEGLELRRRQGHALLEHPVEPPPEAGRVRSLCRVVVGHRAARKERGEQ